MNQLSLSIATFATALILPLTLSAQPDTQQLDNQAIDNDNILSVLSPIDGDATTAFLSLDNDNSAPCANDQLAGEIIDFAAKYLGRPYRLGAKGPSAFDCSGFTGYVFRSFGISLGASSRDQFKQGKSLSLDQVRPGDLMFFAGRRGGSTVGHVVMAVDINDDGSIQFIHASTKKGITYGTFPDGGYYSKRYLGARRIIEN